MNHMRRSLIGAGIALAFTRSTPAHAATASATALLPLRVWKIADEVLTTAQRQILPVAVPVSTPPINPAEIALYDRYGYSRWSNGPGTRYTDAAGNSRTHELRAELAPDYRGAPNTAHLLSFFAITDIHITDKESPAQAIYPGWSAQFGPSSAWLTAGAWTPQVIASTQVLDAAVQTINALHRRTPFDFGIALGDTINNGQFNELRWFIDVLDGKRIEPSSGAHAGAESVDHQRPFQAAGLDKSIPWYTTIGNHDQFWMGILYETPKTMAAHTGATVLDIDLPTVKQALSPNWNVNQTGYYMGVVDGASPEGRVIGAGREADFAQPPTVVPDADRRALATPDTSPSRNFMRAFFETSSLPVGHGYTQANLDRDFACYTFEPRADLPLRVLVLDNTAKKNDALHKMAYYGTGNLDQARIDWLLAELQRGQDDGKLMIIAAHIPIKPQASLYDATPTHAFYDKAVEDALLAKLHDYPNLVLWIAGHRHQNTVTAQPFNAADGKAQPERSFWEVETASLRDFPQQLRTFELRLNQDGTLSILITNVDPAVAEGSPAARSRAYAVGAARIYGATPATLADTRSRAYNAELVKQLSPAMQAKLAHCGRRIG